MPETKHTPDPPAEIPGGTTSVSRRRLTLQLGFEWFARIVGVALGIAVAAVLTRYLGPSRFGDFSLALTLTVIAHNSAEFGFKQAAVREASLAPEQRDVVAGTYVALRSCVAVVLFGIVAGAGLLLARDGTAALSTVIVGGTLALAFLSSAGFLLTLRLRNELFAGLVLVQSVLWLVVVVAAAWLELSLVLLAVGFFAVSLVVSVVTFVLAQRLVPFRFSVDRTWLRRLLAMSLPLFVAGLLAAMLQKADSLLVYKLSGARDGGLYSSAYRLLDQLQLVPSALMALLGPLLARWQEVHPERFRAAIRRAGSYILLAALPLSLGTALFAEPVVVLLYGQDFQDAAPFLAILGGAFLFISLSLLYGAAMIAVGQARRYAVILGAMVALSLTANLTLIPVFGPKAAALTTVVAEALAAALLFREMHKLHGAPFPTGVLVRALPGVGAYVVVGLATNVIAPWPVALVMAAASYLLVCLLTRAVSIEEVRSLFSTDELARV